MNKVYILRYVREIKSWAPCAQLYHLERHRQQFSPKYTQWGENVSSLTDRWIGFYILAYNGYRMVRNIATSCGTTKAELNFLGGISVGIALVQIYDR